MPIKRSADPINVKRIWDAIRYINLQKEQADLGKITRYLQSPECPPAQAEIYVKQALKDGLIITSNGKPLQKNENPPQTFKITSQELPTMDGKDWYCFECHLAGEVTCCSNCFRVFHAQCNLTGNSRFEEQRKIIVNSLKRSQTEDVAKDATSDTSINISSDSDEVINGDSLVHSSTAPPVLDEHNYVYDERLCCICNIANIDTEYDLDKVDMNYLLKFVLQRIRSWLPTTITHTMAQEDRPEWLTDGELTWRANQLIFAHRDMSVIDYNVNTNVYSHLCEFYADILTIQHNIAIFHGRDSQEYGAAELMIRDTIHDTTELRNCSDCYKHSNEKINQKWFCLPCRVPHEIVWAKQKGYPYWPAKVMRKTSSHYDVRFFGGKYERALLTKSLVKPITTTKESLKIKSSAAFVKAYDELKYYQKLLDDPTELEQIRALSKRKRSVSKGRSSYTSTPTNSPAKRTSNVKGQAHTSRPHQQLDDDRFEESEVVAKRKTSYSYTAKTPPTKHGEEEPTEFSFRENNCPRDIYNFEEAEALEQVTSSTENYRSKAAISPRRENGMQQLDHPYSDSVEKMRRKLELLTDKTEIIKRAMECMQTELDRVANENNDNLKRLFESHNTQISETKKKQWCYNCEQDAIYHCCWNTAYCSQTCQQQHWQAEHKKVCRRKR